MQKQVQVLWESSMWSQVFRRHAALPGPLCNIHVHLQSHESCLCSSWNFISWQLFLRLQCETSVRISLEVSSKECLKTAIVWGSYAVALLLRGCMSPFKACILHASKNLKSKSLSFVQPRNEKDKDSSWHMLFENPFYYKDQRLTKPDSKHPGMYHFLRI